MDIKETTVIKEEFSIDEDKYIAEITLNLNGESSWIEYREYEKDGVGSAMSSEVTIPSMHLMEELGKRLLRYANLYRFNKATDEELT